MLQDLTGEMTPDPGGELTETDSTAKQQQAEDDSGQAAEADPAAQQLEQLKRQLVRARENLGEFGNALRHLPVGADYIEIEQRYLPVARQLARLDAERRQTPEYEPYQLAKIRHAQADDQFQAAEQQAQSEPDYHRSEKYQEIADWEWQTRSRLHRTRHQLDLTPPGEAYRRVRSRSRLLLAEFDRIQEQVRQTDEWQGYIQAGQLVESLEQEIRQLETARLEASGQPEPDPESGTLLRAA